MLNHLALLHHQLLALQGAQVEEMVPETAQGVVIETGVLVVVEGLELEVVHCEHGSRNLVSLAIDGDDGEAIVSQFIDVIVPESGFDLFSGFFFFELDEGCG